MVKNPPAKQETCVRSLGREDPLEKGMATSSGIPAWRILQTEEPGQLQPMGHKQSDMTEQQIYTHAACLSKVCSPNLSVKCVPKLEIIIKRITMVGGNIALFRHSKSMWSCDTGEKFWRERMYAF